MKKTNTKKTTAKVENKEIIRLTKIFVNEIKDLQAYYNQEMTNLRNKNANLSASLQKQIESTEGVFARSDKRVRNVALICTGLCFVCLLMGYFIRGL